MKYIDFTEGQGPESLHVSAAAIPQLKPGQVLVKVAAFGVNRADTLQRQGKYPPPPGESSILGLEVSGTVEDYQGDCGVWRQGDEVFGLVAGGGYAEYVAVDYRHLMPVPAGMSLIDAAGIAEVFLTAFQSVFSIGELPQGGKVLVHAGASGVGLAATQLAAQRRCQIAVTASSEDKLAICKAQGANLLINYKQQDFAERVKAEIGEVDVILDMVGGNYLNRNLKVLKRDGRMVYLAMMAGRYADNLDMALLLAKRASIIGSTLRNRDDLYKANLISAFSQQFLPDFVSGKLRVNLDSCIAAEQIGEAHRRLEANQSAGKLLGVW